MSLLFGDQDAEEAQAAGKRLGMLFDTEDTSTQDAASTTFKYEPESKPKPAPSKGSGEDGSSQSATPTKQSSQGSLVYYATTINQLYKTSGLEYEPCGPAACCLMEDSPRLMSLIVYDRSKAPFFTFGVNEAFTLVPQKDNYVALVSADRSASWSLLFPSESESEKFVRSVAEARLVAAALVAERTASGGDGPSDIDPIVQDLLHSSDDKVAEEGDLVQVQNKRWTSTRFHARPIKKEAAGDSIEESVVKFEVGGKKSSSVPSILAKAVKGMRRGGTRIAMTALPVSSQKLPDQAKEEYVYTVSSYEVVLAKIKKSKAGRKNTFSEDQARTGEIFEMAQEPAIAEEGGGEGGEETRSKTSRGDLVARMAALSAAQNPLAAMNVFGRPRTSSNTSATSVSVSPSTREVVEPPRPAPAAGATGMGNTQEAREGDETTQRGREDSHGAAVADEGGAEEHGRREEGVVERESNGAHPSAAPGPPSSAQYQMVLPSGWHYIAPAESMPPPSAVSSTATQGLGDLSAQMKTMEESIMGKLVEMQMKSKSEKRLHSEYKAKKRESVLRAFESVLSSLVQEMSGQEGWTEALGAALEAAVEREKEGFKACLDEDPK